MRISDWSSDVCSSDLTLNMTRSAVICGVMMALGAEVPANAGCYRPVTVKAPEGLVVNARSPAPVARSEERTSELQSLMRISYAVFCLKKKTTHNTTDKDINSII